MRRLLPALALAVAAVSAAPAVASPTCVPVETKYSSARVCATLSLDDTTCASAAVDPSKSTVDDVVSAYVCLGDPGDGQALHHCVAIGRAYYLCTR